MFGSSISRKLSFHARRSLKAASHIALSAGSASASPKHLLLAIFLEKGSLGSLLLRNAGVEQKDIEVICFPENITPTANSTTQTKTLPKKSINNTKAEITIPASMKQIITRAYSIASQLRYPYVGSEHLLFALIESTDPDVLSILSKASIDIEKMSSLLKNNFGFPTIANLSNIFDIAESTPIHNEALVDGATPFLDQYGIDLTDSETSAPTDTFGRFRSRENEIERIMHVLGRRVKNNPLLIGEPGVGKTTLVHALAHKIRTGTAGPLLTDRRIITLDLALVVAGTNFRGEFEGRLKEIIREATEHPEIILFIDEIHTLVGAGNVTGGLDAANILKPALSRGDIQCIGATTLTEHKRHIEKDPALERRFQPVFVSEPTSEEAERILRESRKAYEDFHSVLLPDEVIRTAVDWSVRYIPDRFLPDKAFDLIDEASSAVKQANTHDSGLRSALRDLEHQLSEHEQRKEHSVSEERYEQAIAFGIESRKLAEQIETLKEKIRLENESTRITLTPEDIAQVVSRITRIPFEKIIRKPGDRFARLETDLNRHIIGQKTITDTLAQAIVRTWSGIGNENRPLGSFLFLGPSGVGKTLTAKVLASTLFENKHALIRLDMSEFMERHTVAQMIGAPAGYIGYGEGGKLTEQVRRQPYSVILFDEIEKAHPDVFNILLQILDEGYLTDAEGRRISFRNTIVILTSNIGTRAFDEAASIGFQTKPIHASTTPSTDIFETAKIRVLEDIRHELRPELLNRLDHILVFKPLETQDIRTIVTHELNALKKRLASRHISAPFPASIIRWLTKKSTSGNAGARLVRHLVETLVETPIAYALLDTPHTTKLSFTLKNDTLVCSTPKLSPTLPRKTAKRKSSQKH